MKRLLLILCILLSAWIGRSQDRITQGANKLHSVRLISGRAENAVYSWQVTPASGTSTNVGAVTDSATTIVWDGPPGVYILTVSVIDGNGCVGEQISKEVEILASGDVELPTHAPVAQDDYDTTEYRTVVKIYVLNNDYDSDNDLDLLSLMVTLQPMYGSANIDYNDFAIQYVPGRNFHGTDQFEYRICDATANCDVATVYVLVKDFRFFIPDAFSPNNDGINDYFEIRGIGFYEGNSIEIFNRWGNRVYKAENYGINTFPKFWDGKPNTGVKMGSEELPTGTYFYVLNLGNGEKRIVGSVYLNRL